MRKQSHNDSLSGSPRFLVVGVPVRRAPPVWFNGSQRTLFSVHAESLSAVYQVNYWWFVGINYSLVFVSFGAAATTQVVITFRNKYK